MGEAFVQDPDFWLTGRELWRFDELHGDGAAKLVLAEAAPSDPDIQRYLAEFAGYEEKECAKSSEVSKPKTPASVESVLRTIQTATKREGRLRRWGINATPADRAKVVDLLKIETESTVLVNALWCLSDSGLPEYDETLLWLVFHDDESVRFQAVRMFSRHREPQVRAAGLTFLEQGDLQLGLKLLKLSGRSEDSLAIVSALAGNALGEDPHDVFYDLIELLEENETLWEPMLPLFVYEFSPCMLCRERAIELLVKWGACPDWLIEESMKDAAEDIRNISKAQPPKE